MPGEAADRRRASGVPGRSLSLIPTLSAEKSITPGRADNRVVINVGGVRYETYKSTLKNIPDTRLSWITETTAHNSDYDPDTGEYFFDRHPGVFNMIINYYRTGKLHAPVDVCGPMFEEELAFWGIDEKQIEPCCWMTYRTHRDAQETLAELDDDGAAGSDSDDDNVAARFGILEDDLPTVGCWERWQPRAWSLLEEPYSSKGAQVMAATSMMFVILSIASFSLETHVYFRRPIDPNVTLDDSWAVSRINTDSLPLAIFDYVDYTCVGYFTIELILRLTFCPDKLDFFKHALNWVDLLSVLPFYIEKLIRAFVLLNGFTVQLFKTIRVIRIFRIFKLTRHFSGLKILGHTIKASAKEMLLLIMFLVISILIFACLIYLAETVAEEHPKNFFKNIPIGLWWATVTMTTLGYGDMFPRTGLGYMIGGMCAVAGVLVLALPVPVIVNNFALYYSHAQARLKLPKKRKRFLVGAADMLKTQTGLPGESLAEAGRVSSPSPSDRSTPGVRKVSCDSMETSVDSGIKTGESNDSNGVSVGISVIFTDELAESPRRPTRSAAGSRPASTTTRQPATRPSSGRSRSLKPNGVAVCPSMLRVNSANGHLSSAKDDPYTRRLSLRSPDISPADAPRRRSLRPLSNIDV